MFGGAPPPQSESTPFHPRNPYAVGKVAAHWFTVNYRDAYDLHRFQRDPLQPRVAPARQNLRDAQDHAGGGADRRRPPGHALPRESGREAGLGLRGDFVVATGRDHSVRDFLDAAFGHADLDWHGHVVPALLRRFHEGKRDGRSEVTLWGTGTPRRELLHVDDLADAVVFLAERGFAGPPLVATVDLGPRWLPRGAWVVTEALPGADSLDRAARVRAGRDRRALLRSLGRFVRALHEARIEHRDLKDANVLVEAAGAPGGEARFRLLDLEDGAFDIVVQNNLVEVNRHKANMRPLRGEVKPPHGVSTTITKQTPWL